MTTASSESKISNRRVFAVLLEAGIKVEAQSVTVATASILCHRFLRKVKMSENEFCPFTIATACLFLAGKLEENHLKTRDIINVFHRILHPDKKALEIGDDYWDIRDGLGRLELHIVRTLEYKLTHNHPHRYMLHYLKTLTDVFIYSKVSNF